MSSQDDTLSDEELDLFGFVSASERRQLIVLELREMPLTPKQLSERTDVPLSHVSNLLSELTTESVAEIVNPERKRGRVYRLTPSGERVAERVAET